MEDVDLRCKPIDKDEYDFHCSSVSQYRAFSFLNGSSPSQPGPRISTCPVYYTVCSACCTKINTSHRRLYRMVDNCVTGEEIHQKRSNFAIVDYSCIPAFSVCGQDQVITHMYRLALVWVAIKIEAHVTSAG